MGNGASPHQSILQMMTAAVSIFIYRVSRAACNLVAGSIPTSAPLAIEMAPFLPRWVYR
jgi:hypothetical protein